MKKQFFSLFKACVCGMMLLAGAVSWERLSAAIGLAIFDESMDDDADSVLKRADRLMYQNKKDMKAVRT